MLSSTDSRKNISPIKQMEELANEIGGVISLSQGIPAGNSAQKIREYVISAIENNLVDKYSPVAGIMEFREKISQGLAEQGMRYDPASEIICTVGGMEALSSSIMALVDPGDEVIVLPPVYSYYYKIIALAKAKAVDVPLLEDKAWGIDLEGIRNSITENTKAILLCNPNNPTGSIFSKTELLELADLAEKHDFYIISDDVYQNLIFEGEELFQLAELEMIRKRLVRIVSLSKDFNLTGWRVGFMHSDASVIQQIMPVHDALVNCAPVISQYAGIAALENSAALLPEYQKKYAFNRELVCAYLDKLSAYGVSYVVPRGTYYVFPDFSAITKKLGVENVQELCFEILREAKVSVVPGSAFGACGEGHVRICFGRETRDVEEGMRSLVQYVIESSDQQVQIPAKIKYAEHY